MDTRLFINTDGDFHEVDLYDDIDIPVTYNVADVADISKKDSNWSLSVKFPNTNNNAQLFELIEDISIYGSTFEMLKQYPAYIEVGCNRTFEGYFKLTKVIINDDRDVYYEGSLYSNVMEFMKKLGTTTLRGNADAADDLDFSEYTTVIDESNWYDRTDMIIWNKPDPDDPSTWTPTGVKPYGSDFYFCLIDKFNLINHFYYDSFTRKEYMPLHYNNLTPFLFHKEILDKIFEWAGFNYVSEFFINGNGNTTRFDFTRMIYPSLTYLPSTIEDVHSIVTSKYSSDDANYDPVIDTHDTIWNGNNQNTTPLQLFDDVWFQTNIDENPSAITSVTPYQFTAPRTGLYDFDINLPFKWGFIGYDNTYHTYLTGNEPVLLADGGVIYDEELLIFYADINVVVTSGGVDTIVMQHHIQHYYKDYFDISSPVNLDNGHFTFDEDKVEGSKQLLLNAGDTVTVWIHPYLQEGYNGLNLPILIYSPDNGNTWRAMYQQLFFTSKNFTEAGSTFFSLKLASEFCEGGNYNPTGILSPTTKKTDFVTNLIRKFNLYLEDVSDKKDENGVYYRDYPGIRRGEPILRIEPRDMYYGNSTIVRDWTAKTDVSSIEFERIDDWLYDRVDFKDFNDKTLRTEDYADHNYTEGEFGEHLFVPPFNISDESTTKIDTKYGQTMCGVINWEHSAYLSAPFIFSLDKDGNVVKNKEYNDRILFVSQFCTKQQGTYPTYPNNNDPQKIWFFPEADDCAIRLYKINNTWNAPEYSGQYKQYYTRNWVDGFDAPLGFDNSDLNFGRANWYYSNDSGRGITSNNCFNEFYLPMLKEYNAPEARLMRCKMYLKSSDIRDLQLSDTIIVNSVAYRINKIKQWKNEYSPVEVELIKIIQSNSVQGQTILKRLNTQTPPKISVPIPTAEIRNEVEGLTKLVDENKDELSKNTKAIDSIQLLIKNLDERLVKLEKN